MTSARTVLGDVDTGALGVVLAHEHLIVDSPVVERDHPHIHLPSADEAIGEASLLWEAGVGTVVDAMPVGSGGDPARLAVIARATGLNVIASTGMHTARYYETGDWRLGATAEELAGHFIAAIEAPSTPCGVVKVAMSGSRPTAQEGRLFEAAVTTSAATGSPVLTHCEGGEGGLAQIELFSDLGIELDRVALSHTDKVADAGYHRDLLQAGVFLCFDQGLRDPARTAGLIADLVGGFGDRLLIGTDGARRSLWSTLGGSPGLAWIMTGFRQLLIERGLDALDLDRIYRDNPARWLAIST